MRALIVDDDADILKWLQIVLEAEGWDIDLATSGEEGLEKIAAFIPELIVLDQMMPGMVGTDVAEAARKGGFDGPILLFSGFLSEELLEKAGRLNLVPISKVDVTALVHHIKRFGSELRLTQAARHGAGSKDA